MKEETKKCYMSKNRQPLAMLNKQKEKDKLEAIQKQKVTRHRKNLK